MTITVTVTAPDNKRAKISRSDGVEYTVEPGTTQQFVVHDGAPTLTVTEEAIEADSAVPRSGGGGHGDPDLPGG